MKTVERVLVGVIGYSQSGKTTRIDSLLNYASKNGVLLTRGVTKVFQTGTRFSRHFIPYSFLMRGRVKEVVVSTLDYTGHDHLGGYLTLNLIRRKLLESNEGRRSALDRLLFISEKIVEDMMVQGRGVEKKLLLGLLDKPLQLPGVREETIEEFRGKLCEIIMGRPCTTRELKQVYTEVRDHVESIEGEYLGINELNKLLCRLESSEAYLPDCEKIGEEETIEVEPAGPLGYMKRTLITAPLLAYLLIGVMRKSVVLFIMAPSSVETVLENILHAYMVKRDIESQLIYLRGAFENSAKLLNVIADIANSSGRSIRADDIAPCLHGLAEEEAKRLGLPKGSIEILEKLVPLTSKKIYERFLECAGENLGVEAEYLSKVLMNYVLEKYQVEMITVLFDTLVLSLDYSKNIPLSTIVLDYTYSDKHNLPFDMLVEKSLHLDSPSSGFDTPALGPIRESLRRLVETSRRVGRREPHIYAILSGYDEETGSSTILEYALLLCLLEDAQATITLKNKDTKSTIALPCGVLLSRTRLHKDLLEKKG